MILLPFPLHFARNSALAVLFCKPIHCLPSSQPLPTSFFLSFCVLPHLFIFSLVTHWVHPLSVSVSLFLYCLLLTCYRLYLFNPHFFLSLDTLSLSLFDPSTSSSGYTLSFMFPLPGFFFLLSTHLPYVLINHICPLSLSLPYPHLPVTNKPQPPLPPDDEVLMMNFSLS